MMLDANGWGDCAMSMNRKDVQSLPGKDLGGGPYPSVNECPCTSTLRAEPNLVCLTLCLSSRHPFCIACSFGSLRGIISCITPLRRCDRLLRPPSCTVTPMPPQHNPLLHLACIVHPFRDTAGCALAMSVRAMCATGPISTSICVVRQALRCNFPLSFSTLA